MISRFLTDLVKYICKDQSWFFEVGAFKKRNCETLAKPSVARQISYPWLRCENTTVKTHAHLQTHKQTRV